MPAKLLFVDDEPKLQQVIKQLFRREIREEQYNIQFALDGVEALGKLQANPQIDVVFTDLNMPKMSGLALLDKLQSIKPELNPVLTTVVISAYGDMDNIRKAMNAGAFDFINKPLDFGDMRITLSKAIAHADRLKRAIEQERLAQESLRQINQELERRVAERTAELTKTNSELDAFARTVAHDLKNPLGIVLGYADYTLEFYPDIGSDELLELLQHIVTYGRKSVSIINELLLLAGVRSQNVTPVPVDMAKIVIQSQERLILKIKESQCTIDTPKSWPAAMGYEPWLEEVWTNYMSNGIKYGGKLPRLELGANTLPDGNICFWIKDNGHGLTAEEQSQLFTEFTRLDQTSTEGHGLGLSIVHRIIEKLGGTVGVKSEVGQGSKFYFTLPAAQEDK